jgi:hypothetical protein
MPSSNHSIPFPDDSPAAALLSFAGTYRFGAILADPPWQFPNRTGKVAPGHRRLARYSTLTLADISAAVAHLYL